MLIAFIVWAVLSTAITIALVITGNKDINKQVEKIKNDDRKYI